MSVQDTRAGATLTREAATDRIATWKNSLANMAIGLLTVLITLLVSVLVGGAFADAIPTDNAFGNATEAITSNGETAFTIFAVGLLVIPAVGIIFLVRRMGAGGMGGK